jgi:hypothetical protein
MAITAPTSGTPAMSSAAVEEGIFCSADATSTHGMAISMIANAATHRQCRSALPRSPRAMTIGSRISAPSAVRTKTTTLGETSSTATRIRR